MSNKVKKTFLLIYILLLFVFVVIALSGFVLNCIYNTKGINGVVYLFVYVALTVACLDILLWVKYIKLVELIKRIYYVFMLGVLAFKEVKALSVLNVRMNITVIFIVVVVSICVLVVPAIITIMRWRLNKIK